MVDYTYLKNKSLDKFINLAQLKLSINEKASHMTKCHSRLRQHFFNPFGSPASKIEKDKLSRIITVDEKRGHTNYQGSGLVSNFHNTAKGNTTCKPLGAWPG